MAGTGADTRQPLVAIVGAAGNHCTGADADRRCGHCGDFRDFVGEGHEAEKLAKGLSESVAVEAGHYDMLAVDLDRF